MCALVFTVRPESSNTFDNTKQIQSAQNALSLQLRLMISDDIYNLIYLHLINKYFHPPFPLRSNPLEEI